LRLGRRGLGEWIAHARDGPTRLRLPCGLRSGDKPGVGHKCHFGPCGRTFGHGIGLCGVTHAEFSHKPLWMIFPVFWGWMSSHFQKRLDERKSIAPSLGAQVDRKCASQSHVKQSERRSTKACGGDQCFVGGLLRVRISPNSKATRRGCSPNMLAQ